MSETVRDRYVSFANIDCYENAILVLDAMHELFQQHPEARNELWVRFEQLIPEDYQQVFAKKTQKISCTISVRTFFI